MFINIIKCEYKIIYNTYKKSYIIMILNEFLKNY